MRKTLIVCMVAIALATVSTANAQVFSYSFTDTNQVAKSIKPVTNNLLNPTSTLTLNLISGLDRYERIKVIRNSDQAVMYTGQTTLVGISDRVVAPDGSEYYGKNMALPALGEGAYTVINDTLDIQQNKVSSTSYTFTTDKTSPAYTSLYPNQGAGYGMVLSGDIWELGRAGTGQWNIFLDGVNDSSGIDSVRMIIKRLDGSVITDRSVEYDSAAQRAFFTWARDGQTQAGMPNSDLNEIFTFNFTITDKAGNIRRIPSQKFKYDDQIGEYSIFAVHDARVSTSVVPGISSGYVPYKRGLVVLENPYRVVFRFPKNNWQPYRNGGLNIFNSYGGNKIIAEDGSYVYVEATVPQGPLDQNFFRINNTYEWSGEAIIRIANELVWDPNSVKTPNWRTPAIERQKSDGSWFNSVDWTDIKTSQMPLKLTNIKFNVEARPYVQYIDGPLTCDIPVGSTSCTVANVRDITTGTTGYMHDGFILRSRTETAFQKPVWENIVWHTLGPNVTSYSYNDATNILTVTANQPNDGAYFDHVHIDHMWLSDKSKNDASIISGVQTSRNMTTGNATYEFKMKDLPEGAYDVRIIAQDTYENIGYLDYKKVIVDNTAPNATISYQNKPVSKEETVLGLENIQIKLFDELTTPRIKRITMRGGPTSDYVELSWVSAGNDTYNLNYPRVFPSLYDSETYLLTVTVSDEQNNTRDVTAEFKYLPNNLIRLDNLRTLAVSSDLKTSDNIPLAVLYASQLRKENGQLATGPQQAILTVRRDAMFGITINGVTAQPGESKNVTLDLGLGESKQFAIFPAESGKTGSSEFIIEIPFISQS